MIEETPNYIYDWYNKYKPCYLEFIKKELVPKENEDNDKDYQYMYTYKIVPCNGKFRKIPIHKPYIYIHQLIDQYLIYYKDN